MAARRGRPLAEGESSEYARRTAEILRARGGVDETAIEAIVRHNETLGLPRETRLQHALAAAETVTGLVQDLASLKPKSVVKRMKEKGFAASVNREIVLECETIGIPLAEFAQMAVEAMRSIAPALGLYGSVARKEPLAD